MDVGDIAVQSCAESSAPSEGTGSTWAHHAIMEIPMRRDRLQTFAFIKTTQAKIRHPVDFSHNTLVFNGIQIMQNIKAKRALQMFARIVQHYGTSHWQAH
jgi:hypothetical protein